MTLRDLWRKITAQRIEGEELDEELEELDLRHSRDTLPGVDHFVQPPKPFGQNKPKY